MRILVLLFVLLSSSVVAQDYFITDSWDLNSYADEQTPFLTPDGKTIFFTRAHHGENIGGKADPGDLWYSYFTDTTGWVMPLPLPETLNTKYYNGGFGIRNNEMSVYGVYRSANSPVPGISLSSVVTWPDTWSTPKPVEIEYFQNRSANHGNTISADGSVMIMALESFKTHGAEDLYVSFWNTTDNRWAEPKNLGDQINTKLQELTPYLAPDNKTLFFSSNGHGGEGSRDVFVSQRLDESWTNWTIPRNMGPSINTEGAEMAYRYYPDLELAVYTTTMDSDGYGDIRIIPVTKEEINQVLTEEIIVPMDIADVELPKNNRPIEESENTMIIRGKITDLSSGKAVFARAKILGEEEFVLEHFNDSIFSFVVKNEQDYVLQVDAEGYFSKQIELKIKTDKSKEIVQNVEIEKLVVGARVELKNVLFVRGTTDFIGSSYAELDLIAEMMMNNPSMKIELSGHTDAVGNAQLNLRLSQERVDAVINYLIDGGIDRSRLSGKGYGGTVPVASNATEATRKLNRRVEFTIVSQ